MEIVKLEITEEMQNDLRTAGDELDAIKAKIGSGFTAHTIKVMPEDIHYMTDRIDQIAGSLLSFKKYLENQ